MCKNRILVVDGEAEAALAAGWSVHDLLWERKQERALECAGESERTALRAECLEIARACFAPDDPRLGTSYANAAVASKTRGDMMRNARRIWSLSPAWVDHMRFLPRGRSSLHHFRLAQKNKAAYESAARRKMHDVASAARLQVESGNFLHSMSAAARLALWRAEKPPLFDDGRKLAGACCLLATDG